MRIGLLGPFVLADDHGQHHEVTARERALLALLALHVGRALPRERLIDALWGTQLPANPANALQQRVTHARRALQEVLSADGADGDPTRVLTTAGGGYLLDLTAEAVDVHRFEAARARGTARSRLGTSSGLFRRCRRRWRRCEGPRSRM